MFSKHLRVVCILVLLAMFVAACGEAATPTSSPAAAPTNTAATAGDQPTATTAAAGGDATATTAPAATGNPVTINVFAQQGAPYDLKTNTFTQELQKQFNITFNWETTTWDNTAAKEARQIQLASGDYPDLYLLIPWVDQFSQAELMRYGQQGILVPLNDLIEEHAPNIQKVFEENPDFKAVSTAPDGKIYGLTQLIDCYHCAHTLQMYINTAFLEKLGLEMPTTTEEFKTVLQAFKTQDPNGNGKADEIPLTGNAQFLSMSPYPVLLQSFLYYGGTDRNKVPLYVNNGKVETAADDPEYREGLRYVADLYKEELIDQGAFSQNLEAMQKLGNNAEAMIVGSAPTSWGQITTNPEYGNNYNPVPALEGPGGVKNAFYGSSTAPGATFVLTNKASPEVQVAAIRMLDHLFTPEGGVRAIFGEEGKQWRKPQAGDVAVNPDVEPLYATIPAEAGAAPPNNSWGPLGQYFNTRPFRDAQVVGSDIYAPANAARRLQEASDLYAPHVPEDKTFPEWALWPDLGVIDEEAQLQTNLGDYIHQNTLQFITGGKSLDADWDSYIRGLQQLNLTRYLEIEQQAYEIYLKSRQ